ncbi:MAG TPA: PAS domain-containing protein [bacterium]|nr:MAG: Nitrogen regulation protein NR(II) [bacterium ADurb.Bin236]HPI76294.1 PAS domain-containing protein [bacterium]HPN93993.1 PAS domain-containing protein [bacterium]
MDRRDLIDAEDGAERPLRDELGLRHLQSRHVMMYVACVAAAVLVVGAVSALKARSALIDRTKTDQLALARSGAEAVAGAAGNVAAFAQSVAASSLARGKDYHVISSLLKSQIEHMPAVDSVYLFSESRLLASSEQDGGAARALVKDKCLMQAREGVAACYSSMYKLDSGKRTAYVFVPSYGEGGGVSRVVAAGFNLDDRSFSAPVTGLASGKSGFSFLVDAEGRLVASGDPDKEEGSVKEFTELLPVKAVLSGQIGSMVYRYGKVKMAASFTPVESMGWGLITQRPYAEAAAGADFILKTLLLFLILFCGAAGALSVMETQSITRFLFMLGGRMDAIARGHLNQEIGSAETGGFAPLASAFNRMVASISTDRRESGKTLESVRETARFNQAILSSIQDLFMVIDRWNAVIMANERAEAYMPKEALPCMGKGLGSLGGAWAQKRLASAVRKAIETAQEITVSDVRFQPSHGGAPSIYDFRVYPLTAGGGGAVIYGREVSETVNRHEKIAGAEKFFREISTDAPEPLIAVDGGGKIEWMNPAAARALNAAGDIVGVDFFSLVAEKSRNLALAAARNAAENMSEAERVEIEIGAGGEKSAFEMSVCAVSKPAETGGRLIFSLKQLDPKRDVERSALFEKPLLEKKIRFLSSIIDCMPEEMAVVGDGGKILMANAAFARRFEARKEIFLGKSIDALNASGDGPIFDTARLDIGGAASRELTLRTLRGQKFFACVSGAAVKDSEGNKACVVCVREIGSEMESRARDSRLLEARTKTRLARAVADRFESVLDNLNADIKELGGVIFAPETRAIWEDVVEHAKELSLAANSLMMYSVDTPAQMRACDVNGAVAETLRALEARDMLPPNVNLETRFDRNCPEMKADENLLKMAIWHLAANAANAASKNGRGGQIVARTLRSEVDGSAGILVEILDNGPEYPQADISRFFEPFYGTNPGGMGLGLTLARRAILKHGGRIGIDRSGGFTRAGFFIPLEAAAAPSLSSNIRRA